MCNKYNLCMFIKLKATITSDNTGTKYLLVQRMQTVTTLLKGVYEHMHLLVNYNLIDKQFTNTWMDCKNVKRFRKDIRYCAYKIRYYILCL